MGVFVEQMGLHQAAMHELITVLRVYDMVLQAAVQEGHKLVECLLVSFLLWGRADPS